MTSNLGGRQIVSGGQKLGFKQIDGAQAFSNIKTTVQDELKRTFNPEFLNRIDDVIVFRALVRDNMKEIVHILLGQFGARLKMQDITLELTPEATELLIDKGFDPALGARPLKRAIQRLLEDPFAEFILRGQIAPGSNVQVTRKDEALDFITTPAVTPNPSVVPNK